MSNAQLQLEESSLAAFEQSLEQLKRSQHPLTQSSKWLAQLQQVDASFSNAKQLNFGPHNSSLDMFNSYAKTADEIC